MQHFKLSEFQKQSKITDEIIRLNINALVARVLDPARAAIGMPIIVTSGYRSLAWEMSKNRSGTSQHCRGEAADLKCADNAQLFKYIADNLDFDQLIWEKGDKKQPAWVHVSFKRTGINRRQKLRFDGRNYIYMN